MRRALLLAALLLLPGALAQAERPAAPVPEAPPVPREHLSISAGVPLPEPPAVPAGVPVPFHVVLANPSSERARGNLTLSPAGSVRANETSFAYDLGPGETLAWPVLVTAALDGGALAVEADGPLAGRAGVDLPATPALSVETTPEEYVLPVGGKERVSFRANLTNVGPAAVGGALSLFVRGERAARVEFPPLAPGETRAMDLGEVLPPAPADFYDRVRTDFYVAPWTMSFADDPARPALALDVQEGRLASARAVGGHLQVAVGPSVRIVEERMTLGQPSVLVSRLRNDGDAPVDVSLRVYAFSPLLPLEPSWRLPEFHRALRLAPGEETLVPYEFVPRVATTLEFQATIQAGDVYLSDTRRVSFDSPVRMAPLGDVWTERVPLRGETRWRVEVDAGGLPDPVLRVAVAPRNGPAYEGLLRGSDVLDARVEGPGRLGAARETREVAVRALASGSFLVVPYVESGGVAYPGGIEPEALVALQEQGVWYDVGMGAALLTVDVPSAAIWPWLPLLPAVLVAAGAVAVGAYRRLRVK